MKRASNFYKIIIDSNIWISFLIGKNLQGLQYYIDSKKIQLITCNEQIVELNAVFKKPKLAKYFSKKQVSVFFDLLEESSEFITLTTKSDLCRDPKDNYLVSLAIDSKADYLITSNKDLIELDKIGITSVISFADFDSIIKI
ncbi:MAG: putative toxin-antitoxin system toxin component, PIN family [Salinivirgaceae bacterium]|nr:putative toxin-antitoxin system toxin component, PIN family [Salinivirgaceae bacterium]